MSPAAPDGPSLPAAARAAWEAWLELQASKEAHFTALEAQQNARSSHGPSLAGAAHLHGLLEEHTRRVQRFKLELQQLKNTDVAAHQALLARLSD